MIFNSLHFAVFFPIVFLLYWLINGKKLAYQNLLLLITSYYFYACWDWRFLFLLLFSTLLDFLAGIKISESSNTKIKKIWFWLSISINLGFLAVFKYFNFFAESFAAAAANIGLNINPWSLNIILPVGISFYTFHGLSYIIDVYNGRIKPEKNIVDYSLFVSFFPLLVAGPIERATHLLPQLKQKRIFNYANAVNGLRQILWGLFKKVVIADQCAELVNTVFGNHTSYSGFALVLGAIFFAIQIYGDFSGYSDIALGIARMLGINLLTNFAFPYFSRDIAEFWRRWHISLSSWFKDYVYIPLGGSKNGRLIQIRNTFIIFIVSGFWHGANWTFIVWGALHALFFLPLLLRDKNRNNIEIVAQGKLLPSINELLNIFFTFALTTLAWIFFRSDNLMQAFAIIKGILIGVTSPIGYIQAYILLFQVGYAILGLIILFIIIEWLGREKQFALANIEISWHKAVRYVFYFSILLCVFWFAGKEQPFIYFQF